MLLAVSVTCLDERIFKFLFFNWVVCLLLLSCSFDIFWMEFLYMAYKYFFSQSIAVFLVS
jgi:hypothetical protein